MKKGKLIIVKYWYNQTTDLGIVNGTDYPYSNRKRNQLIKYIMDRGFALTLIKDINGNLVLWVAKVGLEDRHLTKSSKSTLVFPTEST